MSVQMLNLTYKGKQTKRLQFGCKSDVQYRLTEIYIVLECGGSLFQFTSSLQVKPSLSFTQYLP